MSYRKKHYPPKPEKSAPPFPAYEPEYSNPGTERMIHTGKLTSGLPYQRPVNPKEVDRLIREWDDRLLDPIVVSFRFAENEWQGRDGGLQGLQWPYLQTGS